MVHPCLIFSNASDRLLRRSNEIYRNEIDKAGCIPASWVQSVTQSSQPCFNSAQTPGGKNVRFYSQNLVRRPRSGYRRIRSSACGDPNPCGGYHTFDRLQLQYRLFQYSQLDCPVASALRNWDNETLAPDADSLAGTSDRIHRNTVLSTNGAPVHAPAPTPRRKVTNSQ